MRLFIVERTLLEELAARPEGPSPGDVVAYIRESQAPFGRGIDKLRANGVTVEWIAKRLDETLAARCDSFVDQFCHHWHLDDAGQDVSVAEGQSLGYSIAHQLITKEHIGFLVRSGELCRLALDANPGADEVISDLKNGVSPWGDISREKGRLPVSDLLAEMAAARGLPFRRFESHNPLPTLWAGVPSSPVWPMLKTLIGGFRPRYLMTRLRLRLKRPNVSRIYIFVIHGLSAIVGDLAKRDRVEVIQDQVTGSGGNYLRYDQLFALPSLAMRKAARRLRTLVKAQKDDDGRWLHNGVDYGAVFNRLTERITGSAFTLAMVRIAQVRKMLMICRPRVIVVGAEHHIHVRTITECDRLFGYKVVYIHDGLNATQGGYSIIAGNLPRVLFLVPGAAHENLFGRHLPVDQRPEKVVLPHPLALQVRGLRPDPRPRRRKRVLAFLFGHASEFPVFRLRHMDRYYQDLAAAARELVARDIEITYRPHHGEQLDVIHQALAACGLSGKVKVENVGSLADALKEHDVLICNITTCYYQALYAGWPAIFYEPEYDPRHFIGLPAEPDSGAPIASTPDRLVALVLESLNPESASARFAETFAAKWGERIDFHGVIRRKF